MPCSELLGPRAGRQARSEVARRVPPGARAGAGAGERDAAGVLRLSALSRPDLNESLEVQVNNVGV